MELKGKSINCDPYVLKYFLPEYEVCEEVSILTKNKRVIYTGRLVPGIKSELENNTVDYILTKGNFEYDLTDSAELVNFVFRLKDKEVPKYIQDQIEVLEYVDVIYYCIF